MMIVASSRESELARRLGKPHVSKNEFGNWLVWTGENLFTGWSPQFFVACEIAKRADRRAANMEPD